MTVDVTRPWTPCPGSGEPARDQRTAATSADVVEPGRRNTISQYGTGICPACGSLRSLSHGGLMRVHGAEPVRPLRRASDDTGRGRVTWRSRDGRFRFTPSDGNRWHVTATDQRDEQYLPPADTSTLTLAVAALEHALAGGDAS